MKQLRDVRERLQVLLRLLQDVLQVHVGKLRVIPHAVQLFYELPDMGFHLALEGCVAQGGIDSAGVRILFELARRLRSLRQELRIAVPADGIVRRVLVLTALGDVVPLETVAEDAVQALQARA